MTTSKGGRPPFEPTDEQRKNVEAMTGFGIPQEEIAALIENPQTGKPITKNTLCRHFRQELDTGKAKMISVVANCLYKTATERKGHEHVTACIFILKTQGGWTEKTVIKHTGEDDGPIRVEHRFADEFVSRITSIAARLATGDADKEAG